MNMNANKNLMGWWSKSMKSRNDILDTVYLIAMSSMRISGVFVVISIIVTLCEILPANYSLVAAIVTSIWLVASYLVAGFAINMRFPPSNSSDLM
jgi:hypothetical protein